LEDDFLIGAAKLVKRRFLHQLGAAELEVLSEGVEEIPLAGDAAGEVADRLWIIEVVQSEVSGGETALPQAGSEGIDLIVADGCRLPKTNAGKEAALGHGDLGVGNLGIGQRHLARWIFFQSDGDRLRQTERRLRLGEARHAGKEQACGQDDLKKYGNTFLHISLRMSVHADKCSERDFVTDWRSQFEKTIQIGLGRIAQTLAREAFAGWLPCGNRRERSANGSAPRRG